MQCMGSGVSESEREREKEGAKLSANVGTAHEGVGCGNLCSCHCVSTPCLSK